jgi:hypothetical protein
LWLITNLAGGLVVRADSRYFPDFVMFGGGLDLTCGPDGREDGKLNYLLELRSKAKRFGRSGRRGQFIII